MFPTRFVESLDVFSKGQEIYKRSRRVEKCGDKTLFLAFTNLTDLNFPKLILKPEYGHIQCLELGGNNLQQIPKEIAKLVYLQELNAPDNPFLWKIPAELAGLKDLR